MPEKYVRFIGDHALGLTFEDKSDRDARAAQLRHTGHWCEVIPGMASLTVVYDPMVLLPDDAKARLEADLAAPIDPQTRHVGHMDIPVCYAPAHAPDLAHLARTLGLSEQEIITRHTGQTYRVDIIGFTPGFAYLDGGDMSLTVNRLDRPRQQVPAGSVGITTGRCGLYALAGPGGWPVIGRTPLALFDSAHTEPFRLQAGMTVTFKQISAAAFEAWS